MKAGICPSILSFDLAHLKPPVQEMMASGASWIHFDVMDGQFVPPITFGDSLVSSLRPLGDTPFEAHLMTETPERHFEAFAKAGCRRIIYHAEATRHAYRHAQALRAMGLQAGIALNPATPAEVALELLDTLDLVLVMTVNPGWGGQEFIGSVLSKVSRIRSLAPEIDIQVDGGIDPTTLPRAKIAGANLFVVGSYLERQPCLTKAMEELNELCG